MEAIGYIFCFIAGSGFGFLISVLMIAGSDNDEEGDVK